MNNPQTLHEQSTSLPAEHRGMPAKDPVPQKDMVDRHVTEEDASEELSLHLPHERDQSTAMTATGQAPIIKQALIDEQNGLEDTSKEPEMLDAYRKQK